MGLTRLSTIKVNKKNINANLPSTQQTFAQLLISVPPWAKYRGSAYLNNILPDESGNNRNADCVSCNLSSTTGNGGGTVPIPICRGVSTVKGSSTIIFPVGSIPQGDYTIAFITRYSGGTTNRILCGHLGQNYILGHQAAKQGVLFDSIQWCTPIVNLKPISNVTTNITDWLSMCVVNNGTAPPNNIVVNGIGKGSLSITPSISINQLAINTSLYLEKSSFELAHLVIWDVALTQTQMKVVTDSFANYLLTGVLI
jgi:hypothetical protein